LKEEAKVKRNIVAGQQKQKSQLEIEHGMFEWPESLSDIFYKVFFPSEE
jgi:hypothetical protein